MERITKKEIESILTIFKSPDKEYNANSLSSIINITRMGALKIVKRLEKQGILKSKKLGKSIFYKINLENDYAAEYLIFLFKLEAEQISPYIKRWVNELRKIKNADIIIIFGSVLNKESKANDIDVLFVTDQKKFNKLKKEIERINNISEKRIHPIYQTVDDLENNIKKNDRVILEAIKGIIVLGYKNLIEVFK